jgi:hypothetical protein
VVREMTTTESHPLPAVVCTSWCADGDGHTTAVFRGDQTCWGPASYVDLSLEEVTRDDYGVYVPRIGVMAYRRRETQAPSVYVHLDGIETHLGGRQNTLDESVHLTAGEAMRLIAALQEAVEEIGGNQTIAPRV